LPVLTQDGRWDHRRYGTATDPVHQSDLVDVASPNGCSIRFGFKKRAVLTVEHEEAARGATVGTAVHKMLERLVAPIPWERLRRGGDRTLDGKVFATQLAAAFDEEVEVAAMGRPVRWDKEPHERVRAQVVVMVREALRDLFVRVGRIYGAEVKFRAKLGDYHTAGALDLLYEPVHKPGALAFLDWKTGLVRVHQIILSHGYQSAIYAHAIAEGDIFINGEQNSPARLNRFPEEIYVVHLRDFLPYSRRTVLTLERSEEISYWGSMVRGEVRRGTKIEVSPSSAPEKRFKKDGTPYKSRRKESVVEITHDRRGPAWYRSPRTPEDVARLKVSLAAIVGTVRLGRFYESIGEQCARCEYRAHCLGAGYVGTDEVRGIEAALKAAGVGDEDGLGEESR